MHPVITFVIVSQTEDFISNTSWFLAYKNSTNYTIFFITKFTVTRHVSHLTRLWTNLSESLEPVSGTVVTLASLITSMSVVKTSPSTILFFLPVTLPFPLPLFLAASVLLSYSFSHFFLFSRFLFRCFSYSIFFFCPHPVFSYSHLELNVWHLYPVIRFVCFVITVASLGGMARICDISSGMSPDDADGFTIGESDV